MQMIVLLEHITYDTAGADITSFLQLTPMSAVSRYRPARSLLLVPSWNPSSDSSSPGTAVELFCRSLSNVFRYLCAATSLAGVKSGFVTRSPVRFLASSMFCPVYKKATLGVYGAARSCSGGTCTAAHRPSYVPNHRTANVQHNALVPGVQVAR